MTEARILSLGRANHRVWVFTIAMAICLLPSVSAATALLIGVALGLSIGHPFHVQTKQWTHRLLMISIIGIGAGMNLEVVGRAGLQGFFYTAIGILLTLAMGMILGKTLGTGRDLSILISTGTAICGGSAIAAIAPVIRAKSHEISVALVTVFLLNALALLVFPLIGFQTHLTQSQFGLWAALAIHDTSSVVGATLSYGARALQVGTTVKLSRALWIIPVTFFFSLALRADGLENKAKPKRPWFILGFVAAAALVTWIPSLQPMGHFVDLGAKRLMVLALFLIGSGMTRKTLAEVGIRPLVQGVVLWALVAASTFLAVKFDVIGVR